MKIKALEGLRGWLAIYVLVSHCIIYTAYFKPAWEFLRHGHLAVDCFIILSGFVISLLLDTRREAYLPYITRRFFRLYPAYLVFVAIGLGLLDIAQENSICLFLYSDELATVMWVRTELWGEYLVANCISKLFMLHGIIPNSVVPAGAEAFLGSAWSISLEWQFYLIAPVLLWFCRKRLWLVVMLISLGILLKFRHLIPMASQGATLPAHIEFFAVGILSYFLYKRYSQKVTLPIQLITIGLGVIWFIFGRYKMLEMAPVVLWSIVLVCFVCRPLRGIQWVLTNPVSLYLGKVSFSVYLCHELVITVVQYYLYQIHTYIGQERHFTWLLVLTVPLSIMVATLSWYLIEMPGMRLGVRLAKRFERLPDRDASN